MHELQTRCPRARVVYCSATGASDIRHMAYMGRLGLWGAATSFEGFDDFAAAIGDGGVGAMELVALDMKRRGLYLSRQLSFAAAEFGTDMVGAADMVDLTASYIYACIHIHTMLTLHTYRDACMHACRWT